MTIFTANSMFKGDNVRRYAFHQLSREKYGFLEHSIINCLKFLETSTTLS